MNPRSRAPDAREDDNEPHPLAASRDDFETFYRTHYDQIAKALAFTLGDIDAGVEAADEGMARAYPRWKKVGGYDNPSAWVYRVGLNWARSVHRRLAKRLPFVEPQQVSAPSIADPKIEQALRDLEIELRAVVVCRLLLDWSVDATARALNLRPGTVKSRQHRALRLLERRLDHLR